MKQTNVTFWEASLMSGFSQLQLWILVQKKILKPILTYRDIKIDMCKLREWIILNSRAAYQLQLRVDERDIRFSFKESIKTTKRLRDENYKRARFCR